MLHHRLYISLSKVTTNGLGGDGLVLDILECLGNLNSIFSLFSAQKPNSMTYVSGGNDGWTTSRGFGKVRAVFGANATDSGRVNTSSRVDIVCSMT